MDHKHASSTETKGRHQTKAPAPPAPRKQEPAVECRVRKKSRRDVTKGEEDSKVLVAPAPNWNSAYAWARARWHVNNKPKHRLRLDSAHRKSSITAATALSYDPTP